jgi:hypothetical protein
MNTNHGARDFLKEAIAQQLQQLTALLRKAGPLLEDLKDLKELGDQLKRIADRLESGIAIKLAPLTVTGGTAEGE